MHGSIIRSNAVYVVLTFNLMAVAWKTDGELTYTLYVDEIKPEATCRRAYVFRDMTLLIRYIDVVVDAGRTNSTVYICHSDKTDYWNVTAGQFGVSYGMYTVIYRDV